MFPSLASCLSAPITCAADDIKHGHGHGLLPRKGLCLQADQPCGRHAWMQCGLVQPVTPVWHVGPIWQCCRQATSTPACTAVNLGGGDHSACRLTSLAVSPGTPGAPASNLGVSGLLPRARRSWGKACLLCLEAVQPGGWLVQENEARLPNQFLRDGQPLLLAA